MSDAQRLLERGVTGAPPVATKPRVPILMVDDNSTQRLALKAVLLELGCSIVEADSGIAALRCVMAQDFAVILLDVMMPDMDGFEVCRRLKSNPVTHYIPVVMVTALDSPADRVRGLEAGADDFLTKPVSDVVLLARVRSLSRRGNRAAAAA